MDGLQIFIYSFLGIFMPNIISKLLHRTYYSCVYSGTKAQRKPPVASSKYIRDENVFLMIGCSLYLAYTILSSYWNTIQTPTLYNVLGVQPSSSEREIKSHFRKLSILYHPDKVSLNDRQKAEHSFINLQRARDVLTDPTLRFVYDRLGFDYLNCANCKFLTDYLRIATTVITEYYGASLIMLLVMQTFRIVSSACFWRYAFIFGMFLFELSTVLRPDFPVVLSHLINPVIVLAFPSHALAPYQLLRILRLSSITLWSTISCTFQFLSYVLTPSSTTSLPSLPPGGVDSATLGKSLTPFIVRLLTALAACDENIDNLVARELAPFSDDEGALREIRACIPEGY